MVEIFLKTLPFFAIIGLGYLAAWWKFFSREATVYLTKFVFYFALSAMIFQFSAKLNLSEFLSWNFVFAYLCASVSVYCLGFVVGLMHGIPVSQAAVEAQCCTIGNVGFLGIPMLAILLGPQAIGYVMIILAVDLIVFGSLIVLLILGSREGKIKLSVFKTLFVGLLKNPMIMAILIGILWSISEFPLPGPLWEFVTLLGAASTPCALFAIGASLVAKTTERIHTAVWISFVKLVIHPVAVAVMALLIFEIDAYAASVMIVASALPVAGNIYILAEHYRVAPQRVSASILISTIISIFSVSLVMSLAGSSINF